ncbi:Thiamine biosynthesis lipoprotein ApbE precursor [Bacteroidales bacterium Barb6]|nr:Thiamine biosynthesis lipoprotein ApbE precursor [Bacteroidales bacterium Barb6]
MKQTIAFLFLSALLAACAPKEQYFEDSGTVFHTLYHIKYQAPALLTGQIDAELQAFNLSLNPFNVNSVIAKINRNEDVEADDYFTTVFNRAMYISEMSGGMFDITCAPMINLWGFGTAKTDSVTPQMIDSIKQFVGYRKVRLEGKRLIKDDPRIQLNCSAIAKGYACDVVASLLERNGVENYMVEIGGEIVANGVNNQGNPWRIGIRKPEDLALNAPAQTEKIISLNEKRGMATSGDYLNYYLKDGKKYAHTINPKTGYPAEQNILSATVLAADCMTADGFATAFNALGLEEACRLADTLPELDYFFIGIDETGQYVVKSSKGMEKYTGEK